jgi:glycosyltransferase involved in cell wall biosynthesis
METLTSDRLNIWREEGRLLIQQNYKEFRHLVSQAKDLMQYGKYEAAAVYVGIAAQYAQFNHCGFYTSPELEQILLTIGQKTISTNLFPRKITSLPGSPKNILHICTNVSTYGGPPRLIRRWIQQDTERSHSLALIRQAPEEVPKSIKDAVFNSQGKIYILNNKLGGVIAIAKRLRKCASTADIVVLHGWESEIVPMIAFANKEQAPPIIYTNHGDHWCWLGAGISDVVANLRESGMRLSQQRRGIKPEHNMLLPTILEPAHRVLSRSEAKRQLGIDENSILLLSIARSPKYRTIDGMSFADAHLSLLKQYKQVILVVIGPGDSDEDWSAAIQQTQGRIRVLRQTEDTAVFYQAADIYVDSFPVASNTSLLEAGSYGTPLVSRSLYSSDASEILCADMPGLTGNLIRVLDLEEYTAALSRLIEDEEFRLSLGEATRTKLEQTHWGANWLHSLENLYLRTATLRRITTELDSTVEMFLGEPDVFSCTHLSLGTANLHKIMQWHMPLIPLEQRLNLWFSLVKQYGFRNNPLNLLLPQWFISLRSHYYSWLHSSQSS